MWVYLAIAAINCFIDGWIMAIILAISAVCLKVLYSRAAAITLLCISIIGVAFAFFKGFSIVMLNFVVLMGFIQIAITVRAVEATYKIHRNRIAVARRSDGAPCK